MTEASRGFPRRNPMGNPIPPSAMQSSTSFTGCSTTTPEPGSRHAGWAFRRGNVPGPLDLPGDPAGIASAADRRMRDGARRQCVFLASICDLLGSGEIVTIDVDAKPGRPVHPRITYIKGSSIDPDVITQVHARLPVDGNVLVILDSDHHAAHVERELSLYAGIVSVGSYLIVEDTTQQPSGRTSLRSRAHGGGVSVPQQQRSIRRG